MGVARLLKEVKRRKVLNTVAIYLMAAWGVLQVSDLAFPGMGIPESAIRYIWIALIIGLPLAVFFGWRYDFSTNGVTRTPSAESSELISLELGKNDLVILSLLVFVVILIVTQAVINISQTQTQISNSLESEILHSVNPNSIAVLPFEDLSGQKGQAYFAMGMHDELITKLSKIKNLQVTSRTSAINVDRTLLVPQIAKALGVSKIIEGSVSLDGDFVRVIVQLIDAKTDTHTWAETYRRKIEDIISLQNEISLAIADAIRIELSQNIKAEFSQNHPTNPETYKRYLQGMFYVNQGNPNDLMLGIKILEETVAQDPDNPLALSGLAFAYTMIAHSPFPGKAYPRVKELAAKALELNPELAEAHLSIGAYQLYYEWNWPAAEASLNRAIDLNPSLTPAYYHLAWLNELLGNQSAALKYGEKTRQLSPLDPFFNSWLAEQYRIHGQPEKALSITRSVIENYPDHDIALLVMGFAYGDLGMHQQAIEQHSKLAEHPLWPFAIGLSYAKAGFIENAETVIESLRSKPSNELALSLVYGAIGNKESTFKWLEEARKKRTPWYPWLLNSWQHHTDEVLKDARLAQLKSRLNLSSK